MKKKNLLKCLALTSMLALSVGAVTSCGTQGEAGKDGAQGATGAQGAQGEKGDKGDKGDTSYEVIVLGATGGTISLKDGESYTGIKGDTRTLVFTPSSTGDIVISLSINYEDIALTDEILNGSLELTFADQSFIVSATFGDVSAYVAQELNAYYDAIVASDAQVKARTGETQLAATKQSGYYLTTLEGVLNAQVTAAQTTVGALASTATAKEKIDAAKVAIKKSEDAILAAYNTAVTNTKTVATTRATTLYETEMAASSLGFVKENREAFEKACKEAITSAKTISDVAAIIDAVKKDGKYDNLEAYRLKALKAINSYITDTVEANDPSFKSSSDDNAATLATLATYGITELPETVATAQLKVLSESSTFTAVATTVTNSKTGSVEGDAAYKAVKDSYESIINTLKAKIREKYDAEINASKIVTLDGDRQNISNIVGTAISQWSGKQTKLTVSNMVSYVAVNSSNVALDGTSGKEWGTCDPSKSGLLGYIETRLTVEVNASFISSAFVSERLKAARTSVQAKLKAAVDTYLADTRYKQAVSYVDDLTGLTASDYTDAIDNYPGVDGSVYFLKEIGVKVGEKSYKVTNSIGNSANDVSKLYAADVETNLDAKATIVAINDYGTSQLTIYNTAYTDAISAYAGAQKAIVFPSSLAETATSSSYADHLYSDLQTLFMGVVEDEDAPIESLDGVDTLIAKATKWYDCINELDDKYNKFVSDSKDVAFANDAKVTPTSTNEVVAMYNDELDAILAGTVTTADQVDSWADGLKTLYASGVAAYLAKVKAMFADSYKGYIVGLNVTDAAPYEKLYSEYVKLAGTDDFVCDSYSSIQNWYNSGIRRLEVLKGSSKAYKTPVAATSGISGTADNKNNITVSAKDADSKYDAGIEISLASGKTLTAESAVTNAGFNANYAAADGKLYIIAFNINDGVLTDPADKENKSVMTANGFLRLPNKMASDGIKTVSGTTLMADSTWYNICLAVDGSAKDFVIEYSFDGITTYRVHVVIKAGLVG